MSRRCHCCVSNVGRKKDRLALFQTAAFWFWKHPMAGGKVMVGVVINLNTSTEW
jgi:hypothetical protein